jgi:uncharacterized protein (TIGR02145 family)
MRKRVQFIGLGCLILFLCISNSCKKEEVPILTTSEVTDITEASAISGGNISSDGGSQVIARGVCWSISENPDIELSSKTSDSTGTGVFISSIVGLQPATVYFVRSYATNSVGTSYGNEITFTTSATVPVLTTSSVSSITTSSATCGGNITSDGGSQVTARGVCWSTSANPNIELSTKTSDSNGTGVFMSSIIGLQPGTVYYVRAFATNSVGTSYGNEITFTTSATLPVLQTSEAAPVTLTTAICGGTVTSDGGSSVTAKGVCWSTSQNPTVDDNKTNNGTGMGNFETSLSDLTPNTSYFVRAYAVNSVGVNYGTQVSFKTYNVNSVQDREGNYYNYVTIGSQVWMTENLKATGGIPIVGANDPNPYTTPGIKLHGSKYVNGVFYNLSAKQYLSGNCPVGWHVPTMDEWDILINYLGGKTIAGGKLKEAGTLHWAAPNTGADNSSGFSAFPWLGSGGKSHQFWSSDWRSADGGPYGGITLGYNTSSISYKWVLMENEIRSPSYTNARCMKN